MNSMYIPVIGLEVHVELRTKSKMFCGCTADHFGKEPNTQTCPVCLGLPGALPVPNKKAIDWCIKLGLALNCSIPGESKFDRKNYFYPDLPKGYQISQYDKPFCKNGWIEITGKKIRIRRVHQEEDTGKLQHISVEGERVTLVDFNRSGVPLVEIVTEPDFHTVDEVDQCVKKLQRMIRYLGISNADMEKGSMRIEPSISLRRTDTNELPNYRVELKNINSFRFVRKAIEYEIARQTEMIDRREQPIQQTRGYSESKKTTILQREKEEAHDYRYFPEPDIPPIRFTQSQISNIKSQIGELPDIKKERFIKQYGINEDDAEIVTATKELADYFEEAIKFTPDTGNQSIKQYQILPRNVAKWIINRKINRGEVLPEQLIQRILESKSTVTFSSRELDTIVNKVLAENLQAAGDYKKGKKQSLMFLVGQVKRLAGNVDPSIVIERLSEKLK